MAKSWKPVLVKTDGWSTPVDRKSHFANVATRLNELEVQPNEFVIVKDEADVGRTHILIFTEKEI